MLVLTRKPHEGVIIGNDITVEILEIKGNQVSIGFAAPENVTIHRSEVYAAIKEENAQAAHDGKSIRKLRSSLQGA